MTKLVDCDWGWFPRGRERSAGRSPHSPEVPVIMLRFALVILAVVLAPAGVRAADPPSDDCRLLDIPKCQIHIVDRALLAAERDGIVREVLVRVGDRVEKGAPVVHLKDEIAAAHYDYARTRASSDINVRYSEELLKNAKEEYDTALRLQGERAITEQLFRQRRVEYERGRLSLEQSQFDFRLAALEADRTKAELEAYHVDAPFAGHIRQVMKVTGESVRDGEPILELVNTDRVHVEGYGNLEDLWNLQPGALVEVWLDAPELERFGLTKERFRGTLIHVDTLVQPVTGKVRVVAEVQNRRNILRDGLRANLQIQIRPQNLADPFAP